MKKVLTLLTSAFLATTAMAQVDYDADITAIFGSGNPDSDWNKVVENGFVLGLRAKERWVAPLMTHTDDVYDMPLATPAANRSSYNIEISVENQNGFLDQGDIYLMVDTDASVGINYSTADVLTTWANYYGTSATANGDGVLGGPAAASSYSVVQLSQNLGFGEFFNLGVTDPAAASTRDFILYVVAKGAGPDGEKLASIQVQVITGSGGASIVDLIAAIDTTGMTHGDYVNAVKAIAKYLFDGGVINNKEMSGLISTAAKSNIGS